MNNFRNNPILMYLNGIIFIISITFCLIAIIIQIQFKEDTNLVTKITEYHFLSDIELNNLISKIDTSTINIINTENNDRAINDKLIKLKDDSELIINNIRRIQNGFGGNDIPKNTRLLLDKISTSIKHLSSNDFNTNRVINIIEDINKLKSIHESTLFSLEQQHHANHENSKNNILIITAIIFITIVTLIYWLRSRIINSLKQLSKTSESLTEHENRILMLLNSTGEGIYGIDTNGQLTFANKACLDILGYNTESELLGKNMRDMTQRNLNNHKPYFTSTQNTEDTDNTIENTLTREEAFYKKDGTCIPVKFSSYPIIDNEEIHGSVITFTDITKELEIKERFNASIILNQKILEQSPVGIAIYNEHGQCILANDAMATTIGATKEQVLQQNYNKIESWKQYGIIDLASTALQENTSTRGEFSIITSFGKNLSVDINFTPIKNGTETNLMLVLSDITERKNIESELLRAKETHSKVEEIVHIGNWDWDILTGKLYWTDEIYNIFGLQPQEFEATYEAFLNTIHPEDRHNVIHAVEASLADANTPYSIEHRLLRHDGTIRIVHERGKVYRNDQGNPVRMIGTVHDITERKQVEHELELHRKHLESLVEERTKKLEEAQDELVRKERLATLGNLTATVSHELRNPLGAMRPSLYILQKKTDLKDEKLVNAIDRIDRNITRCDHIIDELLDFTRINELELSSIKLDDWLDSIIFEYNKHPDIEIIFKPGLYDLAIEYDQDRLRRAIVNIMDNGIHSMLDETGTYAIHKNSKLTIETNIRDNIVKIKISDTGSGIPDNVLPKIFEPLFSTKGFGVGLGMPVVKQIIEQHRGNIKLTTSDKGTTVDLTLPCSPQIMKACNESSYS